ncbi:MAG: MBL fold metallo-hydrolase [Candidatus Gracilibacteria bacterium]|nr:MBL fold metallo-hydrolase [Candidatus Gracilibacteria bacterium]
MRIHFLGHSEFLVEIKNSKNETVKILSDSWLSNYVFGDMMARYPKIEIDYEKLEIDAIFISHSHSDHLDPYTLVKIYENIKPRPILLIPETISFLVPLFEKYLPKQKIQILKNSQTFNLNGIDIKGIIFENDYITNEDDVMTLAISNDEELIYTDVDTVPPERQDCINLLYDLFTHKNFSQAIYMSTRNELPGNFQIIESNSIEERKKIQKEYLEQRMQEIEYNYFRFEEDFLECSDIQELPYFMKVFVGQGIVHPNPDFLKLRILKLDEEAKIEKSIAKKYSRNFPITELIPGKTYNIENRKIETIGDIPFLKSIQIPNPETNLELELFKEDKFGPLENRKGNYKAQEGKIIQMLNTKFLPYRLANTEDNLKNAILNSKNHKYVVKIRYGNIEEYFERNYFFDFSSFEFCEEKGKHEDYNEDYWANDLEDFLEGRQELYSNFRHKLNEKKTYRVWTCLGANFLNNDILYKKYSLHFKRASIGKDVESFVENYIK